MRSMQKSLLVLGTAMTLVACGQANDSSLSSSKLAPTCGVTPVCDAAPAPGVKTGFLTANPKGTAFHFGKDFYLNETQDQWVIAKFQYGSFLFRKDLVHEEVEVQLLRDCGSSWETLGKAFTSDKGEHVEVMGFSDLGGMIFFKIPTEKRLGLGRHRIRLVVSGDQTATELFLEVLPQGASLFVSDVDGTLTTSELIEGVAGVFGTVPPAHPGASALFTDLTKKGYRPIYLTARATAQVQRTREFISVKKFPAGVVQTSSASTLGLSGVKGVEYKTEALQALEDRGFKIAYAFGNTKVDAEAFANVSISDANKYFFKFDDYVEYGGGVNHSNYATLNDVKAAPNLCL